MKVQLFLPFNNTISRILIVQVNEVKILNFLLYLSLKVYLSTLERTKYGISENFVAPKFLRTIFTRLNGLLPKFCFLSFRP